MPVDAAMLDGMAREPNQSDDLFVPVDVDAQPLPADIGLPPPRFFPPPTATTPEGLLCVGGRLSPEWLLDAYRHGIFPWPMWDDEPIAWWSPDPRAIIELDRPSRFAAAAAHASQRQVSRHVRPRFRRRDPRLCDGRRPDAGNTWLTPSMIAAYCRMHELGHAHSVEVWHGGTEFGRRHVRHRRSADCLRRKACSTACAMPRRSRSCTWSLTCERAATSCSTFNN